MVSISIFSPDKEICQDRKLGKEIKLEELYERQLQLYRFIDLNDRAIIWFVSDVPFDGVF